MKRKLLPVLGCMALFAAMTSAAYADDITFTFLGENQTPAVTITKAGGVALGPAVLLLISDTDTNNAYIVPGSAYIDTGAASGWTASGGVLTAQFTTGAGIEVQVDSADCVGGTNPGVCLQGILNSDGAYVATNGSTGSFQALFEVTYVSPYVPALFGDLLPWMPTGSDSFTTGHNNFKNGGLTDTARLGQGGVTYQPTAVPEPCSLLLMGSFLSLVGFIRRRLF